MGKFIDYIVFVVVSTILVLFFYSPVELQETILHIRTAGTKFYFLLAIIIGYSYFFVIFVEWIGFKILDRLINDDR
jgi:hypothetical protein